jgi:hypothetical protein
MTARDQVIPRVLGTAALSIATATTTNGDFGTPDDLKLAPAPLSATIRPGDRVFAVITATTAGTTDATSFSIQDAPDNAGSIGTPAAADTGTYTFPAAATGSQTLVIPVKLKANRPWLRIRATRASGTTDTLVVRAVLIAISRNG